MLGCGTAAPAKGHLVEDHLPDHQPHPLDADGAVACRCVTTSDDATAMVMLQESDDIGRVARDGDTLAFDSTQAGADQVILDFAMAGIAVRSLRICERP